MNDYPDAFENYITDKKREIRNLKKENDELTKELNDNFSKMEYLQKELDRLKTNYSNLKVKYNECLNKNRIIKTKYEVNYYKNGVKNFNTKRFHIRVSKKIYDALLSAAKNKQTTITALINYAVDCELNSTSNKEIELQDNEIKNHDIYFNLDRHLYDGIVNTTKDRISVNQYINLSISDYLYRETNH